VSVAGTREECCEACRTEKSCVHFVFQLASASCRLLMHDSQGFVDLDQKENEAATSGSLISSTQQQQTSCTYYSAHGYAGVALLEPKVVPNSGEPLFSKEACCNACGETEGCIKWTFDTKRHVCALYDQSASIYSAANSIVSGRRWVSSPDPPPPPPLPPPPPPPPPESVAHFLAAGSMPQMAGLAGGALVLCASCGYAAWMRASRQAAPPRKRRPQGAKRAKPKGPRGKRVRVLKYDEEIEDSGDDDIEISRPKQRGLR